MIDLFKNAVMSGWKWKVDQLKIFHKEELVVVVFFRASSVLLLEEFVLKLLFSIVW